jgi:hypothetical protein
MSVIMWKREGKTFKFCVKANPKHNYDTKNNSPDTTSRTSDITYTLECELDDSQDMNFDDYAIHIDYKRKLNKNDFYYVHEDDSEYYDGINDRNIAMYYTKNDENCGDLSMYGIPDEFFKSRNLSKKHNLLVMLNEYVRVFGNVKNEHTEEYFNVSTVDMCEYDYDEKCFVIDGYCDGSSKIIISDHGKMKVFIEMIRTVINYFDEFVSKNMKS